jgi:hypothetical protein
MHKEALCTEAESREQYVALEVILRLIKDPTTRPELKFLCAKELWPHEAMTLAEQSRIHAIGEGGPVQIQINVASWAASAKSAPALPAPPTSIKDSSGVARKVIEVIERPKGGRMYKLEGGESVFEV